MFKKIFSLTIGLAFVLSLSGMALADNEVYISQTADNTNYADITQDGWGWNTEVYQNAGTFNTLEAYQRGVGSYSHTFLKQFAEGYNKADIRNIGGNTTLDGYSSKYAIQNSRQGSNNLYWRTTGGNNHFDLYQNAKWYNKVNAKQYGGNNSLRVFQYSNVSYNRLVVRQFNGGMSATVYQWGTSYNTATITQIR